MPPLILIIPVIACLLDQGAFAHRIPSTHVPVWYQFEKPQDYITLVAPR